MVRILIADDHDYFRSQLRAFLESVDEWKVCGEADDGLKAVERHASVKPHVTVMDFEMPRMNGLDASKAILRDHPEAAILMLSLYATPQLAEQTKKYGIKALCSKAQVECITEAVRGLLRGETYYPDSFSAPI
jgi:two-component system, NarL family, response regulator LiaR